MSTDTWTLPPDTRCIWQDPDGPEAPGVAEAMEAGDIITAMAFFVKASMPATADEAAAEGFVAYSWPGPSVAAGYGYWRS